MGDVDRTKAEVEAHESKGNPHSDSASLSDLHDRPSAGTNLTEDANNNFNVEQGDGSGLDADTVDGKDASDLSGSTYSERTNWGTAMGSNNGDGTVSLEGRPVDEVRVDLNNTYDGTSYNYDLAIVSATGVTVASVSGTLSASESKTEYISIDEPGNIPAQELSVNTGSTNVEYTVYKKKTVVSKHSH